MQPGNGTSEADGITEGARLRLYETLLAATPDLVYVFDLQHRFIYANEALLTMWGLDWDEAMGKTCLELGYEPWHAAMHDEEIERVIATRAPIRNDVPFRHSTLGWRIYDYIFMPVLGPDGRVEAIAGTTRDVTDRKRQEEALRQSEQRFSAMVNATSDLIYRITPDWRQVAVVGGRAAGKLPRGDLSGWSAERIHPEDRERVAEAIRRARNSLMPYEIQHRVELAPGEWSWIAAHAVPLREESGEVAEWFGAATDITDRKRNEEQLQRLVDELNHRVKNTLAIVQAVVSQTLRNCSDKTLATEMVESRLRALAATHDVLTLEKWKGASVEEIVRTGVSHCMDIEPGRFDTQGPEASLDPRRAVALSMALHELCTNAVKYGSLSVPGGGVRIRWTRQGNGGGELLLEWQEHGGPAVEPPTRSGFGLRLLERGLGHDLGGEVTLAFPPEGVRCRIRTLLPHDTTRDTP
ncbi:PAS domain-containing protein [Luteimonas viscosa]|uniref:histidine kinase n=1 Tax=Luteimonas viscosa TaxID=1132694 RepID=A0A5D4XLT8_9GAMM|nr:PAS domain-containing protein [Luteimonas viscosa]